jgi:hypothetical protein
MGILKYFWPKYKAYWFDTGWVGTTSIIYGDIDEHYAISILYSRRLNKWKMKTSNDYWVTQTKSYKFANHLFTLLKLSKAEPQLLSKLNIKYGKVINLEKL